MGASLAGWRRSSAAATVFRVRECPRVERAQVCCCVEFSSIVSRRTVVGYEHKANEDVITSLGVHDCRNFFVTHLAPSVLIEHGSAGAEISVALKAAANEPNDAPTAGENASGKRIMRRHLGLCRCRT
jgi:hypothetical protein